MKAPFFLRKTSVMEIPRAGMSWLRDLKEALAYEMAKKHPRYKIVEALKQRIFTLSFRSGQLAKIDLMKFGPPISSAALLELLPFSEQPMHLLPLPTEHQNATSFTHEAARELIASAPDGAMWKAYSVSGVSLYFGEAA